MLRSVGACTPCSIRLTRVKCWPVAEARAWPVNPAARRSCRSRTPSSLRAWATELLGSVLTGRDAQVPHRLERLPAGLHGVRAGGGFERGVGAGAGVVQEQHQL